jgi:predicted deacylase
MIPTLSKVDLRYQPNRCERFYLSVTHLPDGSPISIPVALLCGTQPGPRLAAVAAVHGDEFEGVKALHHLLAELTPDRLAGTLILAPVVNVMAYNACARRSPVDNVDLNRVFPGNPTGSISERLAYQLCHTILAGCDLVVSLHGWYQNGTLTPWMEFTDIAGRVSQAAHAAARAFGIPDLVPLPLLPGRLISALAEMGIAAIEGEVGGQALFDADRWPIYVRGLYNVMAHLQMLPQSTPTVSEQEMGYWALRAVTAPVGGLLNCQVALGDWVAPGQPLATIDDLFGQRIATVSAPYPGKIASIQTISIAQPGGQLFTILEPTAPVYRFDKVTR